jgi:hypothetical protein
MPAITRRALSTSSSSGRKPLVQQGHDRGVDGGGADEAEAARLADDLAHRIEVGIGGDGADQAEGQNAGRGGGEDDVLLGVADDVRLGHRAGRHSEVLAAERQADIARVGTPRHRSTLTGICTILPAGSPFGAAGPAGRTGSRGRTAWRRGRLGRVICG